jgi:hypothetical protein
VLHDSLWAAVYPQYTCGGTGLVFVVPGVREQLHRSRLWPVSTLGTSAATAGGAPGVASKPLFSVHA